MREELPDVPNWGADLDNLGEDLPSLIFNHHGLFSGEMQCPELTDVETPGPNLANQGMQDWRRGRKCEGAAFQQPSVSVNSINGLIYLIETLIV